MSAPAAARRQDAERRQLERIGVRAGLRIGTIARQHAYAAWRIHRDPQLVVSAVRNVIVGNPRLKLPGMPRVLAEGMTAAHLKGHQRTQIVAAPKFRSRAKLKLAGTAYDDALDFLKKRLDLDDAQLQQLVEKYSAEAMRVTTAALAPLEKKLQQAIADATAKGLHVQGGITALRDAFTESGYAPQADYAMENIFRTQTQAAYAAGRWNSLQDPAVQEIIWGYEYSAIEDDRTTEICMSLDGTKRPKDDPFWATFWPPNHYQCRSCTLEIFTDGQHPQPTKLPEGIQPAKGFAVNFGQIYRDEL